MSEPDVFQPANELEFRIAHANVGGIAQRKVNEALMVSQLYLLVDRPMTPGVWDNEATVLRVANAEGEPLIPAFTTEAMAEPWPAQFPSHPHGQWVSFQWLLTAIGEGEGLLINSGSPAGMTVAAGRLARLRRGLLED